MPSPLVFVGGGAALTAAARAADKANGGGGPFGRLGEGRGAALREAWPAEALHTVPAARRAATGDADELFAYARPPKSKAKREAGERRALQHQEWADAPKEKRQRAAEERAAANAALLAPLAAADTTAHRGCSYGAGCGLLNGRSYCHVWSGSMEAETPAVSRGVTTCSMKTSPSE